MDDLIVVQLTPRQAKQYVMMQFLDSLQVFDIKLGRVIIDFDKQGLIGNVQVIHNYKPTDDEALDKGS